MSCCARSRSCSTPSIRPSPRGFSLIEVLIGIVVLALGLVGLAAVFPSVVRQQQVASDQATGLSSVKSAMATIREHAELRRPFTDASFVINAQGELLALDSPVQPPIPTDALVGWSILTWDAQWSLAGEWTIPAPVAAAATTNGGVNLVRSTGEYVVGTQTNDFAIIGVGAVAQQDPRNIRLGGVSIPVRDRLIPAPRPGVSGVAQPRFVWDMVVRRIDLGEMHRTPLNAITPTNASSFRDDGVQVVVFVRRIDPGIRIPTGSELSDVLTPQNALPAPRLPVAMNANGTPSLDGVGNDPTGLTYSRVQTVEFAFATVDLVQRYDVIDLIGTAVLLPYAAQPGQQFVDQLGVVHKVVEVLEGAPADTKRVRLESPMRSDYQSAVPAIVPNFQLLFTPQIPAGVEVFTVPPAVTNAG